MIPPRRFSSDRWSLRRAWLLALVVFGPLSIFAAVPERHQWQIDGVVREGLVYIPATASAQPTPLVFVFHGHGGSMQQAARSFALHTLWPEAMVVYLQGLKTPGQLTDRDGKKAGWQQGPGDQEDRDLKFFDAVLGDLRRSARVDDRRIYATGHSNGGSFTYILWAKRGDVFAAVAPSGAAALRLHSSLTPKPALHVAGEVDPLVKYSWQKATIAAVLKVNQCDAGRPWEHGGVWHESKVGAPTVIYTHPGGHEFPPAARPMIVKFFQQQVRP